MNPILAGIETEYGFLVEGHGPEELVDDATLFVQSHPGQHYAGWDYRFESPRRDLRGFVLSQLATDPQDALWDSGRIRVSDAEIRSDRVLTNGARFYNDHGHPEYSTPECWSLRELVLHDLAGEEWLRRTAHSLATRLGRSVRVFKNNSDYHGASYGTHESYLVPRSLGFDRVFSACLPMLVVRQLVTGAGKVGAESGAWVDFQMSQRADFLVEVTNAETLFRRPIFNTRDEPHGPPDEWMRLHVICGDANRIPSCTARKVGLVKLALTLAVEGLAPRWAIRNPVQAFQAISRSPHDDARIDLEGGSWTTPRAILESYLDAAEQGLGLKPDSRPLAMSLLSDSSWADDLACIVGETRAILESPELAAHRVDWRAKRRLLQMYLDSEQASWRDPIAQALELAYHDLDSEESLFDALVSAGEVDEPWPPAEIERRLFDAPEGTRARLRGAIVREMASQITHLSWSKVSVLGQEWMLPPDLEVFDPLDSPTQIEEFLRKIKKAP